MAEPDGSPIVFMTRLQSMLAWATKRSLWSLPFGTSCCGAEFVSAASLDGGPSAFADGGLRLSPRHSDLLIVAGTITDKMGPSLRRTYLQMESPKFVIAVGACASTGGMYRGYNVMQGVDEVIPVDVYVAGCPPTPEGLRRGVLELQAKIQEGGNRHGLLHTESRDDERRPA